MPTNMVTPEKTWCPRGARKGEERLEKHRGIFTTDRARNRAKTFPGVAQAMAAQWVGDSQMIK